MRIGVDIFGGDRAPDTIVLGAIMAYKELSDSCDLVLFGDQKRVEAVCAENDFDPSNFEVIHTEESIGMSEHPAKAFTSKADSSIVKGFQLLAQGKIDCFASAGNTGAMLVGAVQVIGAIDGVIRPAIATTVPSFAGTPNTLLDVGLNPDCKPDVLNQYGILGSIYSENVHGTNNPKVGLLSLGHEEEKGNLLTKAAHPLLKANTDINFIGNVEGHDIFNYQVVDVIVCDGFVGNVILKQAESMYRLLKKRGIQDDFLDKFNFEHVGGTPVLGVNAPVIIAHGSSNETAIRSMIRHAHDVTKAQLINRFKEIFV